jgi:hypothetical protein
MKVYKLKPIAIRKALKDLVFNAVSDLNRSGKYVMLDPADINSRYYTYTEVTEFLDQLTNETIHVLEESDYDYPKHFYVDNNIAILQLDGFGGWFGGIDKHILDLVAVQVTLGNVMTDESDSSLWSSYYETSDKGCKHPNKYLNRLSANLSFMVCPDCKKEVQ